MVLPRCIRSAARLLVLPALLLLVPSVVTAQETPTMLVRVESGGRPVAGVEFTIQSEGARRVIATSGPSGLAVIDFVRAPFASRARVSLQVVTCGDRREVTFTGTGAPVPVAVAGCSYEEAGGVVWYRTDRAVITLDDQPTVTTTTASQVTDSRTGFRFQVGPSASLILGSELDGLGVGLGGEALAGLDFDNGFGIGLGVSLARHGIEGLDEALLRWTVFAEPRYTFDNPSWSSRPYISAQLGRQILNYQSGSGLLTEKGWSYGAGGGIVVPAPFNLELDLGVQLAFLKVGVDGFDRSGSTIKVVGALRF